MIETGRLTHEVPLADDRRLVAGLLHELRERRLAAVKRAVVVGKAIQVAVLAGEDHRPRRAADRVGAEAIAKESAFPRDPIDVGRVDQLRAIGGDGGRRMVVGKDEDDVGPTWRGRGSRRLGGREKQSHERADNRDRNRQFHQSETMGTDQEHDDPLFATVAKGDIFRFADGRAQYANRLIIAAIVAYPLSIRL